MRIACYIVVIAGFVTIVDLCLQAFVPDIAESLGVFIRYFGSYPEGVCYSILVMNCCTWIIDKYTKPTRFGVDKKAAKEAAKK